MLLKESTARPGDPTRLAKGIGMFLRLTNHNASAKRPGVETEISQKKHGQREQKFLPVMFHDQDIQWEVKSRHQREIAQFDQAGIPATQARSGYARLTPDPASAYPRAFQTFWG